MFFSVKLTAPLFMDVFIGYPEIEDTVLKGEVGEEHGNFRVGITATNKHLKLFISKIFIRLLI